MPEEAKKAEENQLQLIVRESGLETAKADYILAQFQDYFKIAAEWEKKAKTIVVTDESQKAEMQMARAGRLFLRDKRIAVEKARKELKEQALREGKAIDGIANVLKALIVPIEEYLEEQEKFVEIKAKKKAEAERLEAERKAEEERIAQEKAEAEERERIKVENERLKQEADEREKQMQAEMAKAEAEKRTIEEKARREKEDIETKKEKLLADFDHYKTTLEKKRIEERTETEQKVVEAKTELEKMQKKLEREIECPFCHRRFTLPKETEEELTDEYL